MLGSVGWDRLFILLLAALVVLGPERLPGAVRWVTRTLRQVREQVNRAADQTRNEFGPALADIREPLAAIAEFRSDLRDLTTAYLLADPPAPLSDPRAAAREPAAGPRDPPIDPQAT